MSHRSDLVRLVSQAMSRAPANDSIKAAQLAITAIVTSDDWHIISSATITREDDPPIPDHAVEDATRFAIRSPQRVTTVSARLDSEIVHAQGVVSRELLARDYEGYVEHADAKLGHDFLRLIGHRLGVPGCEDVPERLAKTGHA